MSKLFDMVVRAPNNLKEKDDVDIEYFNSEKIYGLSVFFRGDRKWKFYTGTFAFLYGIYIGLKHSNETVDQINNMLVKELKKDLDNDFHGAIFFNIDSENKPTQIIKSFGSNQEINCRSYLYEPYENSYDDIENEYEFSDRFPRLEFK